MNAPGARKDPAVAVFLSLVFPGAGYAYAGDVPKFVRTFVAESVVFCLAGRSWVMLLLALALHVFMAVSAGGAVRLQNARADDLPPPPPPSHRGAPAPATATFEAPPPEPPPPPVSAGPPLSADEFLAELRDAWGDRGAGRIDDGEFAARKRSAIERVRVADVDDGVALLEATDALVGAGVMSGAERTRLKLRVSRP